MHNLGNFYMKEPSHCYEKPMCRTDLTSPLNFISWGLGNFRSQKIIFLTERKRFWDMHWNSSTLKSCFSPFLSFPGLSQKLILSRWSSNNFQLCFLYYMAFNLCGLSFGKRLTEAYMLKNSGDVENSCQPIHPSSCQFCPVSIQIEMLWWDTYVMKEKFIH